MQTATPTRRSNRIPRLPGAQHQPSHRSGPTLTERLYRMVRGYQIRRTLGQLDNALAALEQHMAHDLARAEQLQREYKTSPTLHARRMADAEVFAELSRRRAACVEALGELEQQA